VDAVDLGEHAPRARRDRLAGLGRRDAAARALEELGAELGLEPANLVRERRLGDVELLGGAGEVPVAGDRLGIDQLPEFDRLMINRDRSGDNTVLLRLIEPTRIVAVLPLTLRLAESSDADELRRLAERDSAALPPGPHLVAVREGNLEAAISLRSGAIVADPFRRTAETRELLRCLAGDLQRAPAVTDANERLPCTVTAEGFA